MKFYSAMLKRYLTITIISLLASISAQAQQDAQFSQYIFNQLYLNPAYTGLDQDWTELSLTHRSQWLGYQPSFDDGGAPTTQLFSLNMPLTKYNLGVGMYLMNDQLGPLRNLEAKLSLAYHFKLNSGATLSLGVRGGMYNQSINFGELRFVDENDPLNIGGNKNQSSSDYSIGLYYNSSSYFGGVSVTHFQESDFSFDGAQSFTSLSAHMNFLVGKVFDISSNIDLTGSILMKSDFNSYSFEGNVIGEINSKFFIGGSLRELEAVSAMSGIYFMEDNRMRLSYSFDYTIEARNAKEATSHEIVLSYRIPAFKWPQKPIIRTPRFRF